MSEAVLSSAESQSLRRIAGMMIPASQEYGTPGADDRLIFADIMDSLGRDLNDVRAALVALAKLAGGSFADLDEVRAASVLEQFLASAQHASIGARASHPAMLLSGRPCAALARIGAAAAIPERPYAGAGRLVAAGCSACTPQIWRDDREVLR